MVQERYHICLGITGHRSLCDKERVLTERVSKVLGTHIPSFLFGLRKEVSAAATPKVQFTALTSLAEGADRIVAREVLRFPCARLEVVLPFSKKQYLHDFESEESKKEFKQLMGLADAVYVTEKYFQKMPDGSPELSKESAYALAGQYIVNHCDILIAIWNGMPPRGTGGTAEVVYYARKKKSPQC